MLLTILGLGLTGPASGAETRPQASTRAQALGAAAAAIDFCARIDRANGAKYSQAARKLLPGATDGEIAKAKSSAEFQAAYRIVEQSLAQLSSEAALAQCTASL
ncbi:MAG TPA: hypothetical protein VH814_26350 [Steroidobacteraceae bacterium]|jgi:hypothetical protein